jgi:steroid delta-isomerase-like uncharacterized protein
MVRVPRHSARGIPEDPPQEPAVNHERMKALYRFLVETASHEGNLDVIDRYYTEDCVRHLTGGEAVTGREALKANLEKYRTAFPGFRMTIHDQMAERDRVMSRWSVEGKHTGALDDLPASGKEIDVPGYIVCRLEGDRIAEEWEVFDELLLMRQIGAIDGG